MNKQQGDDQLVEVTGDSKSMADWRFLAGSYNFFGSDMYIQRKLLLIGRGLQTSAIAIIHYNEKYSGWSLVGIIWSRVYYETLVEEYFWKNLLTDNSRRYYRPSTQRSVRI